MEYCEKYDVNRKMHVDPLTQVVQRVMDLTEKNEGLEIGLEELSGDMRFDASDMLELLQINPFQKGDQVRIIAKGNYTLEELKGYADQIGKIFNFADTSRTASEVLYKSEYGHWPDEEPI